MNKPSEQEKKAGEAAGQKKTWWQRIPRFLIRLFLGIVGLFVLIYLLFQIPAFQNYVANRITSSLSEEWGTKVELERVNLQLFDRLVLENFYIEDLHSDTLLFAEQLKVDLNTGLIPLLLRRLEIQELSLRRARINIKRPKGSEEQNLQFILDKLAEQDPDELPLPNEEKKPFYLGMESLYLEDVAFFKQDSLYGTTQQYYISRAEMLFEEFNLPEKNIHLSGVKLENPRIDIYLYPPDSSTLYTMYVRDSLAEINKWPPDISNSNRHFLFPWDFLTYSDFSFMAWQLEWPSVDSILAPPIGDTTMLAINVDALDLMGGSFTLLNQRWEDNRNIPDDVLNFRDLNLSEIYANIRDFSFSDNSYRGDVRRIACQSDAGFVVKRLASSEAVVDSRGIRLEDLVVETPYSSIGNRLILKYDEFQDFKSFVDEVELDSVFIEDATVAVRDIMAFVPALDRNIYFQNNRDKTLNISGDLFGTINNLSGNDLSIYLDQTTFLEGSFGFFNLTVPENQYLNLELNRLVTNMYTLRQLLPNFNPPENFNKLGKMDFQGRFDGFFYDFVANGNLRSDIGRAVLDMKLNTIGGRENADYSGRIKLIGFDLGRWAESESLGKITMSSEVIDGKGLTASSAEATLKASIDSFFVRGYNYQKLNMNGALRENLFDGEVTITDENIDLDFSGTIDFTEEAPILAFNSNIRNLDFKALNILEEDYSLEGNLGLNVRDIDINKMVGEARLMNLILRHNQDERYYIDSVIVNSKIPDPDNRSLILDSDVLSARMDGKFNIEEIPDQFLTFSWKHFPKFSEQLKVPQPSEVRDSTSHFTYSMDVFDTKGLMDLVDPKLEELTEIHVEGSFDQPAESFKFDLEAEEVHYNNMEFDDIVIVVKAREGGSDLNVAVSETRIGDKLTLAPINLLGLVDRDTLFFGITAYDFSDILNTIEVDGQFYPVEDDFLVRFEQSDIILWNQLWKIDADNYLRIGDNYVRTRDFVLRNGEKRIILESLGRRGLLFQLQNYDLESLNELWVYDKLAFDGNMQIQASIRDVFKFEGLQMGIQTDSLMINEDDFGSILIRLKAENLKSKVEARVEGGKGEQFMDLQALYNPPGYAEASKEDPANYLDMKGKLADYPLSILEYWIGAGVSDTEGDVQVDFTLKGPVSKLELGGSALIKDAAITIDYLNTRYFIDDQRMELSSTLLDATDAIITDQEGNVARLSGGITHDHLTNFQLGVTLFTERFLGLNTVKGQNPLFYGTAYAQGRVTFSGPFNRTDIYVNATSLNGTNITLPVDYGRDATEVSFIKFRDKRQQQEEESRPASLQEQLGLSIILDLDLRENAQISIVFDEQLGDVLRSKGRGNLRLVADRSGDFQLIGNYEVVEGDYLFTLMNIGLNKPFTVAPGGTLKWSGDPFGAEIDLTAQYAGLQTSLTNFIGEYLLAASETAKDQADKVTEVNLTMRLTGELLSPDIAFDIDFPNLTGEIKSYVESKLRLIRQDQNEMNRQVFGLIVVGQFLPSDFNLSGSQINIGFNTVTEMISQQFSNYLTGLISEWLREDGIISGIDLQIDYSSLQEAEALADNPLVYYRSGELEFRLSNYLLNDRLSVNVGGNFDVGGNDYVETGANGAYFAGDLVIEYALTEDRNLKIRFYQSTEPELNGDRLNQTGIGLRYRKQFDSFSEFLKGLRGATKDMGEKRKKEKEGN